MPSLLHEIDPDGDLIVVLKEANTQKVIPDVYLPPRYGSESPDFVLDDTPVNASYIPSGLPCKEKGDDSPDVIRFRVSSRQLMLNSEVFKKMLSGPWKESQPVDPQHLSLQEMHEGSYADSSSDSLSPDEDRPSNRPLSHDPCIREISATGWNAHALLTVFRIIHGQCSEVRTWVNFEFFAHVANIANYYRCAGALSLAAYLWLGSSNEFHDLRQSQRHDGWEMGGDIQFKYVATYSVVKGGHGLSYIETYDLAIGELLSTLETKRWNAIHTLTSALSDMKGKMKRYELCCMSRKYIAAVIGLLELNFEEHPELTVEYGNYDGLSLEGFIEKIQECGPGELQYDMHLCSPKSLVKDTIRKVEEEIKRGHWSLLPLVNRD
ncbi:hypothetical protein FIE12Z_124 [Fusarium flagelliforme]|uniref:BTB domain-containing protein n=1 Tax=Fusarium flagelliforme TaxID=2675880 RepID=A0A395N5R6_9HYPO|nr:hypothetical protein FIE12Z_124 [Fusarium flagelliforme]